jgi:hypothetical protein
VGNDDQHIALPKLYGQPAYARPTVIPTAPVERPDDPDDLPLEAVQTAEERELAEQLAARPYEGGELGDAVGAATGRHDGQPMLRGRPFRIGSITTRFRGKGGSSTDG